MLTFLHDLRFAARLLARQPGFAASAVLTLAAGIGATTAIFTVVNAVVLRPLAFDTTQRVVAVQNLYSRSGTSGATASGPDIVDWQAASRQLAPIASFRVAETSVVVGGVTDYASVARVGAAFFDLFQVRIPAGRTLSADEQRPGGPPAVVITDAYWRRQFHASPAAIGTTVTFDRRAHTIVGVAAPGFRFPARVDIYAAEPLALAASARSAHNFRVVGRLAADATLASAQAEMTAIAARLAADFPTTNADKGVRLVPLRDAVIGDARQTLFLLLGAVGVVLLIACANVATLLLARASARGRELVVRAAIGAGRGRLVRQLLTESMLLAVAAGLVGALLARWGVAALLAVAPADLPRLDDVAIDGTALAFALAMSLLTSVVFGLTPAWQLARVDLVAGLRQGGKGTAVGRHTGWGPRAFVVAEVAMAVVLVTGASLLGRSLVALTGVDLGFRSDGLAVLHTTVPVGDADEFPRAVATYRQMLAGIAALPGVASVGAVTSLPTLVRSNGGYWLDGGPGPETLGMASPQALFTVVTPGYFATLEVPLVRGRDLSAADDAEAPFVAVVNEQFAREAFPGQDPIGRGLRAGLDTLRPMTIVGVVGDIRTRGPARPAQAEIYFPYEQHPGPATALNLVVRPAGGDAGVVGAAAARLIREQHPGVPVRLETMTDTLSTATAAPRFRAFLLTLFAVVALALAVAGVYGVMAGTVAGRVPEIGVRVALGAEPREVLGMVLGDGARLVGAGLVLGLGLALAAGRLLGTVLFGVSAADPATFVAVAVMVAVAALAACVGPSRRALAVDPVRALRAE